MKGIAQPKIVRVLFDEFHSESWSISAEHAQQMQPERPAYSSYQIAADALAEREFIVQRNIDQPLHRSLLSQCDVLVLPHPCDPKWERTTSDRSPRLSRRELTDVREFVQAGGGLVVISEYEHDKYGDNLNELLEEFCLEIENSTVFDRTACLPDNPAWFFADVASGDRSLLHQVSQVCFYQGGSCKASGNARLVLRASAQATPPQAGLIGVSAFGKGRVALVTDSVLFGDEHVRDFGHLQLWLNLLYWSSAPAFQKIEIQALPSPPAESTEWASLKSAVNRLRQLQNPDGSVDQPRHSETGALLETMGGDVRALRRFFPHQNEYLEQVEADLAAWTKQDFAKPNFSGSLAAFNPQRQRQHNREHLVVFPMYTPNASKDTRFEALLIRTPWPEWLAELERTRYPNEKFVPGQFIDSTEGYQSECAVLFPETVSVVERPTNNFAMIFCDREARRLQRYARKAAEIVQLELHPQLECYLCSLGVIHDANALWDLIHDKSHSLGELPFDPFMIRQRAPFWMYGLEELRVDLRSFCEAVQLEREGFHFAHHVTYSILFDRIFRFPITGPRVRNYDALGGQLLFAYLHQHDVLIWSDNRLTIRWDQLPHAVNALREEIVSLYKLGADCSKMTFWLAGHDLVTKYVKPNVASQWKKDSRAITDESDPKKWLALIHDDEFPLGNFHVNLLRRMV